MIKIIIDNKEETFTEYEKAVKFLESKNQVANKMKSVQFFHIGGYELLRDGTQKSGKMYTCKEVIDFIEDIELTLCYQPKSEKLEGEKLLEDLKTYSDLYSLAKRIEPLFKYLKDDGGGSGWIEYN